MELEDKFASHCFKLFSKKPDILETLLNSNDNLSDRKNFNLTVTEYYRQIEIALRTANSSYDDALYLKLRVLTTSEMPRCFKVVTGGTFDYYKLWLDRYFKTTNFNKNMYLQRDFNNLVKSLLFQANQHKENLSLEHCYFMLL